MWNMRLLRLAQTKNSRRTDAHSTKALDILATGGAVGLSTVVCIRWRWWDDSKVQGEREKRELNAPKIHCFELGPSGWLRWLKMDYQVAAAYLNDSCKKTVLISILSPKRVWLERRAVVPSPKQPRFWGTLTAHQTKLHGCAKLDSELDGLRPKKNVHFEIEW